MTFVNIMNAEYTVFCEIAERVSVPRNVRDRSDCSLLSKVQFVSILLSSTTCDYANVGKTKAFFTNSLIFVVMVSKYLLKISFI